MNYEIESYEGELRKLRHAAETVFGYFRNKDDITVEEKQMMEALRQALNKESR